MKVLSRLLIQVFEMDLTPLTELDVSLALAIPEVWIYRQEI